MGRQRLRGDRSPEGGGDPYTPRVIKCSARPQLGAEERLSGHLLCGPAMGHLTSYPSPSLQGRPSPANDALDLRILLHLLLP
ncbi:unnamed protein product [Gulo gulo]|uniref:Uncharacterized protein n=1 Tax=Gulo gulo TaxID=48420 RepID=A0A9X9LMW1_GULGU|nr:unnamed protein product [Gulo gulo]